MNSGLFVQQLAGVPLSPVLPVWLIHFLGGEKMMRSQPIILPHPGPSPRLTITPSTACAALSCLWKKSSS